MAATYASSASVKVFAAREGAALARGLCAALAAARGRAGVDTALCPALALPARDLLARTACVWMLAKAAHYARNRMHAPRLGALLLRSLRLGEDALDPSVYAPMLLFPREVLRDVGWLDVHLVPEHPRQLSLPSLPYAGLLGRTAEGLLPPPRTVVDAALLPVVAAHTFDVAWARLVATMDTDVAPAAREAGSRGIWAVPVRIKPTAALAPPDRQLVAAVRDFYLDFWVPPGTLGSLRRASAALPQTWMLDLAETATDAARAAHALTDDALVLETAGLGVRMGLPPDVQLELTGLVSLLPPCIRALLEQGVRTGAERDLWANYVAALGNGTYVECGAMTEAQYRLWTLPYLRDPAVTRGRPLEYLVLAPELAASLRGQLGKPAFGCERAQKLELCPFTRTDAAVPDIEDLPARACGKAAAERTGAGPVLPIASPAMWTYVVASATAQSM